MKNRWVQISGLILAFILAIVIGMFIPSLFNGNSKEDSSRRDNQIDQPMLGFSIDSMVIERWQRDVDIVKTRGEELGFQVEVVNAYEDGEKQVDQIRSLIKEGADALLILPHDKNQLAGVVEEAKKQGIVVIAYDRLIADANVDAYISFDNMAVGEVLAQGLVDQVPKGQYLIINGSPSDNNSTMIQQGFYNVLQPLIDAEEIVVVHEVWAEGWREDYAYNAVKRLMEDEVRVDAIICANDLLAEGAISALSEYGMAGEIPVVGQDANISACQRIVEGKQLMTVYKPLKELAEGSVELVYKMIHQQELVVSDTINDGSYDVPYLKFDVVPVNAENMKETVIKDFFHTEEDVYRTLQ